jgi:hypothetical protein
VHRRQLTDGHAARRYAEPAGNRHLERPDGAAGCSQSFAGPDGHTNALS